MSQSESSDCDNEQPEQTWSDIFTIGGQCGLTPNAVLDLSMSQFQAYIKGYSNHLADLSELAIQTGYYSAYYQSKHPKAPDKLIAELHSKREASATPHAVCVDVEAFERQEQAFRDAQSQIRSE